MVGLWRNEMSDILKHFNFKFSSHNYCITVSNFIVICAEFMKLKLPVSETP